MIITRLEPATATINLEGLALDSSHRKVGWIVTALLLMGFLVVDLPLTKADELNVRSYGAVGDGHTDDGPAIQRTINAAIETHRPAQIIIPNGNYFLGPDFTHGNAQLVIEQARDLAITGMPGARLVSAAPQRSIFQIGHSSNIRIGGLILDRTPLLFAQAVIKAVDPKAETVTISTDVTQDDLDAPFLVASKQLLVFRDLRSGSWGDHGADCAFYKPSDPSVCWPPVITSRAKVGFHLWKLKLNTPPQEADLHKPAVVWSGVFKGRGFLINYSRDVTIHDLSYFAEGDEGAFIINHAAGTIKFDHFNAGIPPGSGHLVGSVGGAMVFNNHVRLILDHVDMSQSWDDSINMGANFARIYRQISPTVLQVDGRRADFVVGDRLSIWDWPRKVVRTQVRIKSISCLMTTDATCELKLDRVVTINHPGHGLFQSKANDNDGIDRVIDLDGVGTLAVTDSRFQSLHARCLLIKASHSLVENSLCYDTVMAGIIIGPSFFWDEGPETNDVTIRNNVFRNVSGPNILVENGGAPEAPAIEGVRIINNEFLDYGRFRHGVNVGSGVPILLQKAANPDIVGNKMSTHFVAPDTLPSKTIGDTVQIR